MNDFEEDEDYDMSGDDRPKRNLKRNNFKEVSSESEDEDSDASGIRTRRAK